MTRYKKAGEKREERAQEEESERGGRGGRREARGPIRGKKRGEHCTVDLPLWISKPISRPLCNVWIQIPLLVGSRRSPIKFKATAGTIRAPNA
jgi:hypothetical protein